MSHRIRKPTYCICEYTGADQLCKADQHLCFCYIVQFLYFLFQKFPASSHLICLYGPVCVTPVQKPHCFLMMRLKLLFQEVGCDGVVGSTLRRDHCGVCGGDNDSCRIIAGIYTRTNHRYGYQQITQLPAGACHINVTELARSRNYLGGLQSQNG